jgi:Fe-S cluster biogenesis protein NfuA
VEHFTYFSEIEEHFQRRRGSILICSPLDWALMEVWKEAGIPLEAVLRGIDAAFDKYDRRPQKTRKVNSLAYCQQEVLAAVEELAEAALGSKRDPAATSIPNAEVARYFERNAEQMDRAAHPAAEVRALTAEQAATLRGLAAELADSPHSPKDGGCGPLVGAKETPADLEALERRMTVMEERLFAALWSHAGDEELMEARAQAEHELVPYRGKMSAAQIEQLLRQYGNKQLMERHGLPRLSLFYL